MSVGDTIPGAKSTLGLVRDLCAALDEERIEYCHWKSNAFLDRSRSGESDLDLLVRRGDGDGFAAIVHRLGFKEAVHPKRALPGVVDYYGYDEEAPRLVHLHAHYQLVVGDDLTKSYRIPLEDAFLASALPETDLRVPRPELEFILLVLRLVLKHSTWDALLLRRAAIGPGARAEYRFLEERIDPDTVDRLLAEVLPAVDARAFGAATRALASGSALTRVRRSRDLVASLQAYRRRSRAADVRLKVSRRAAALLRRAAGRRSARRRLVAGGRLVAVVGADGAGKTTLVESLQRWLAKDLDVTSLHLGKPRRSATTRLVRTLVRLAARLPERGSGVTGADSSPSVRTYLRAALAVALARDRSAAAATGAGLAAEGQIVVCDRYPLPELRLMDGPRVERILGARARTRLGRRLVELEAASYGAIPRPDVLLVLRVDPDVAVARKPEEPPEFVRGRWDEIWGVDWARSGAHVLDAGESPVAVLEHAKAIVWAEL